MTHPILLAALVLASVAPAIAHAQPDCPPHETCYAGHPLEFDPADGPVQFLVVETSEQTTTTLDGETMTATATLVEFAVSGNGYVQRGDPLPPYPKTGNLAKADVGDTFGLAELGGSE